MVLLGGAGGSPLSTGAVDDLQKQRRQITGRRATPRRPKTHFGRKFESRRNKDRWIDKLKEIRTKKLVQQKLEQQKILTERAKQISLRDLDTDLAAKEKQAAAKRFREVERRQEPETPLTKFKPQVPFRNPFVDSFPEEGSRLIAQQALDNLPSGVRAMMSMALDEKGALPDKSFSEAFRERLLGARQGNTLDLIEITTNPKLLSELTDVGKNVLGVQAKSDERRKMLFAQRLRREFVPVSSGERLNREQVINEEPTTRKFIQQAKGVADGIFKDNLSVDGRPIPEHVDIEMMKKGRESVEVLNSQKSFIEKIKADLYPGREDQVEVSWDDAADQLIFTFNGVPRGVALPSKLAEQVHGTDIAENFALRGFSALPEDSPLHLPTLGEGTIRFLSDAAELIDGPRQIVKKEIIEPILPEFEFGVTPGSIIPYLIPGINMATIGIKGLELAFGIDIPEFKDLLEEIPGFDYELTITDNIVAEVMSFVLDPLNLLPGIGFGPEIVKLMKVATRAGPAGIRAALRLAKNPKFLRAADDVLRLAKAEAGILSLGGREAQLSARRQVLKDIANGVPTTNDTLKPIRTEIDNILANAEGKTFDLPITHATEGTQSIQLPEGFTLTKSEVFRDQTAYVKEIKGIRVKVTRVPAYEKVLPTAFFPEGAAASFEHLSVDILRAEGEEILLKPSSFSEVMKNMLAISKANPDLPLISDLTNPKLINIVRKLGFKELENNRFLFTAKSLEDMLEKRGLGTPVIIQKRFGIKIQADEIQDALDFGDKVKLQQLGIDPQDIDNPAVLARIREEAPEIAEKIDRTLAEAAPKVVDEAAEETTNILKADGRIIELSKEIWTSKNPGILGDELASELHQFLLAGTQTGGRRLHTDIAFVDDLYNAYAPVREALKEKLGDTIRLVRYQRNVKGAGDRLVVQFADPSFSKNFDPRIAPATDAKGFTKGPAVDRELQRISKLTGQSRKDAYKTFKESPLNKELERAIEVNRLKDKTPVFRYEIDVPIDDIVAMPISVNGKYREFIVLSDVLNRPSSVPTLLAREADGSLKLGPKIIGAAPKAAKETRESLLAKLTKEVDDDLSKLSGGESGGGRLRSLKRGDTVQIRDGQFTGESGRVTNTIKKQLLDVELDSGRVVRVKTHQVDAINVLEEAAELKEIGQLAARTRADQLTALQAKLTGAGPKARKAIQNQIDEIVEQAKLADVFQEATEEGGRLAEKTAQNDELRTLRDRLLKAKGEGRKNAIKKRILALEEVMGISDEAAGSGFREVGIDLLEETKQSYIASQSETIEGLFRRQREIDFQLTNRRGLLGPDELADLQGKAKQVEEELVRIRSEADDAVEQLSLTQRALLEDNISPLTMALEQVERFAFARTSPAGQLVKKVSSLPIVGRIFRNPVNLYDPSLFHADNFIGRKLVAYQRLLEQLEASTTTAAHALLGRKMPFKVSKEGIEELSNRSLFDLVEDWDNVRHLFTEEQDEFVKLLDKVRLEALADMKQLGVTVPDAWFEVTHAFREAVSKDGINFRNFSRGSGKATPGSLRQRSYEVMASGVDNGVSYNNDIVSTYIDAIGSMREYAARQAFTDSIKFKRGVPLKLFVAQEKRLVVGLAAREYAWAKVAQKYVHGSVRGRPAKPGLRASKSFEIQPPSDIVSVVDRIADINRVAPGKKTAEQLAEVRELRNVIDDIAKRNGDELKGFKAELKTSRETINTQIQREGARFGKPGEAVETAGAPISEFPQLSGRLYLKDDIDELMKIARDPKNPFLRFTSRATGIMRTPQTAFDPGFWFIQGLGAMGLDFTRAGQALLRGRPDIALSRLPGVGALMAPFNKGESIWGQSMWRSIVGLTNKRKAAEFWADQASKNPQLWEDFIQHARVVSHQDTFSTEILQELTRGGILAKISRKIPGNPLERVGNAFTNFMNAASWETWKALRPLAKNPDELEELGAFVRALSGRNSLRGLGIGHTQQLIERSLFYAPSYTRATTAIMFKAAFDPLSFGGRQALKSIAGLGMAMTFLFGGVSLGEQLAANGGDFKKINWDDLGNDLKAAWNPTDSTFMTKRIGNTNFGLGGNMRSTVNFMGKMIKGGYNDPENLLPWDMDNRLFINWDHPIMRFTRGKSSPLLGTSWDVLTGQDFLGYSLDKPSDYLKLPLNLLPFGAQAYLETTALGRGGGGGEGPAIGASEWFGMRTFPISTFNLYKETAERELNDTWENLKQTDFLKAASHDADKFPELVAAREEWEQDRREKSNEFQELADLHVEGTKEKEAKLVPAAIEVDWGRPGGGKVFADRYKSVSAQYSDNYALAAKAMGIEFQDIEDFPNKDAELETELIALDPYDNLKPDGTPDWDRFNADADAIKAQMTPRNRRAVENKKFNVADPRLEETLRRRAGAIELLQPYFDAPKYKGLTKAEETQVDDLIKLADEVRGLLTLRGINVGRSKIFEFMLKGGVGDPKIVSTAFVLSKSNIAHLVKTTTRRDMVFANPDLVTFYSFVFYDLNDEDQEEWTQRFSPRSAIGLEAKAPLDLEE